MSIVPYPSEEYKNIMQSVVPGNKNKKRRRLSFADDYDGGELTSVEHVDNLHYSPSVRRLSTDSDPYQGQSSGCCVIC